MRSSTIPVDSGPCRLARIGAATATLRFSVYLQEGYLATFDSAALDNEVSRNSVAHGVADPAKFDKKAAVTNLLLVSQLYYFLEG